MKIVTWNVNGIRSAIKRGLWRFVNEAKPDILCLQELKIAIDDLAKIKIPPDYSLISNCADKKGYSGVLVLYKRKMQLYNTCIHLGIGRFDQEGRFIDTDFNGFKLINIYIPHGGRQKENLGYKLDTYEAFISKLRKFKNDKILVCGDFNIAHKEIDLARPKNNMNNTMFTADEREKIDEIINLGLIDTFRKFHSEGGNYTWWPWMANCRKRNLGWRIDYIFASRSLAKDIKNANILNNIHGSDHCPISVNLKRL
jgi:exodeoxyribonuclease-3